MNDLTFEILKITVSVMAILVTRYLIPWLKAKTQDKVDELTWIQTMRAVRMVEQTLIMQGSDEKKRKAVNIVADWAIDHGINITADQIDDLVESAVFVLNSEKEHKNG